MYSAPSKTILDLSKEKLGTIPGFSLLLHTWCQILMFHPHLHYILILVGGGLSLDQTYIKSFKKKFFIHVRVLSTVFKGIFLEGLKPLHNKGKLVFPSDFAPLDEQMNFKFYEDALYAKDCIVYSKSAFKSPSHLIKYFGRYTHKIAIYDSRIITKEELLLKLIGKERLCCPKFGRYFTYNHSVCLS